MIKPGTMCVIIYAEWKRCKRDVGKFVTATGPPIMYEDGLYYPVDIFKGGRQDVWFWRRLQPIEGLPKRETITVPRTVTA